MRRACAQHDASNTFPVEYNASRRAREQLETLRLVDDVDKEGVRDVLKAAALTYVAGTASSAGYLLFLLIAAGRWLFRRPPAPPT